ncbi:hypothetical protein VTL71DRAFT_4767 [Oculimacula yallundae]|uniref:Cutinase n=1 Tax=Oculimacula yallundae TaxID=86028 RepID=A0ABR4C2V2_9HELO
MPSPTTHILIVLCLLTSVLSSPIPNPQTSENAISQSTYSLSTAQTFALSPSQRTALSARSAKSLINSLIAATIMAPIINTKVAALSDSLNKFSQGIATVLSVDTTVSASACSEMMVIFARGTTEPGNVGLFAGPAFFKALEEEMGAGTLGVQGVEYGASIEGFLKGGDPIGSTAMAALVTDTIQKCPNSKIVLSGYSQGAQLCHNAATSLPAATMAKVNSVVIFGDPNNGKPVANVDAAKTLVICHKLDNICAGGDLVLVDHLTYSIDAKKAAAFVASRAKL